MRSSCGRSLVMLEPRTPPSPRQPSAPRPEPALNVLEPSDTPAALLTGRGGL